MFLYYVPRVNGAAFEFPRELRYASIPGRKCTYREVARGPDNTGPGWIVSTGPEPSSDKLLLDLPKQRWMQIYVPHDGVETPPDKQFYVGRYLDQKLMPDKLARETQLDGHWVELGDGSRWLAAIARRIATEPLAVFTSLPRSFAYDPKDGKWLPGPIVEEYKRFADLAFSYGEADFEASNSGDMTFRFDAMEELAVLALTANYRIGSSELALYDGVFTVPSRNALVHAACDFPTYIAWLKKKQREDSAGLGTEHGLEQSTPAQAPST